MTQVIIFENENGGVSVCTPTGELDINAVKSKDTPSHSIIVDASELPQGDDAAFFDAWELNSGTVSVNIEKAKVYQTNMVNNIAKAEAQHRMTNSSIGLDNKLSDADWIALLTNVRSNISQANTTTDLVEAIVPLNEAISDNK